MKSTEKMMPEREDAPPAEECCQGAEAQEDVRHAEQVTPAIKQQLLRRLGRIEGQVRGLARMIDDERYCPDVLVQLSAVHESLRAVGKLLLRNHLEHCVTSALRSGDAERAQVTYEELADLFYKHAR